LRAAKNPEHHMLPEPDMQALYVAAMLDVLTAKLEAIAASSDRRGAILALTVAAACEAYRMAMHSRHQRLADIVAAAGKAKTHSAHARACDRPRAARQARRAG
jgi:hypothetical protein